MTASHPANGWPSIQCLLAPASQPVSLGSCDDSFMTFLCVPLFICACGVTGFGSPCIRVHARFTDCRPVATVGHVHQPLTKGGRHSTDTEIKFSSHRESPLFSSGSIPQTLFRFGF